MDKRMQDPQMVSPIYNTKVMANQPKRREKNRVVFEAQLDAVERLQKSPGRQNFEMLPNEPKSTKMFQDPIAKQVQMNRLIDRAVTAG